MYHIKYVKVKQKKHPLVCSWCRWPDFGHGTGVFPPRGRRVKQSCQWQVCSQRRGATCCGLAPTGVKSQGLKIPTKKHPLGCSWCRWPDSNRHGSFPPRDFKSLASAISPHRHIKFVHCLHHYP